MKFKTHVSHNLRLLLIGLLFGIISAAFAVTGDSDQPINIDSENQLLDLPNNVATFTGNVIVTQGTIKITAEKLVVIRPNNDNSKTIIDAWGSPATFYQMQDNGKHVQGHAEKMHYELDKEFIELNGNAYLEQLDSNIKGDRITYLVKQQKMQAYSSNEERVTTILTPAQLQDKNPPSDNKKKNKSD